MKLWSPAAKAPRPHPLADNARKRTDGRLILEKDGETVEVLESSEWSTVELYDGRGVLRQVVTNS